jgi:CDP-paratose 2-epimerase
MKYLITGGCGFLGSNIASALIAENTHEVHVMDNLSRHGSEKNLKWLQEQGKLKFTHGDICNADDCNELVRDFQPDIIFHFAGQVAMTTSLTNPRLDFNVNALGTLNMLEAVRIHCPLAAVIYSSTNKVYGDLEYLNYSEKEKRYALTDYPLGIPENLSLDFHSPYGCSKGSADQYILDYARMFGLKTTVFRHSSMYGIRQFSTSDQGWIGWFCEQAVRQSMGDKRIFTISGNGKQVRDVLHSTDMVELYLSAARQINHISGSAFNIGGGMKNSLSILELMDILESNLKTKLHWKNIPERESDQRVFVADLTKIEDRINWTPKIDKNDGIKIMINWVKSIY